MAAEQRRPEIRSSSRANAGSGSRSSSGKRASAASGSGTRTRGHSAVAALLADNIEQATPRLTETASRARRVPGDAPGAPQAGRSGSRPAADPLREAPLGATGPAQLPPIQDVALGLASVTAETLLRVGARGAELVSGAAAQVAGLIRGVSPSYVTTWVDGRLLALADRGERVRVERTEAVSAALTNAMTSAVTSDAMRDMTVTAVEQATDDVLAVVLPAMMDAVNDRETQKQLDELMAGLLLRQLPDALEKTLPGVMVRTATRTSLGIVPSLMGALTSGLSSDQQSGERR